MTPPRAGPTIDPKVMVTVFRALAAGSCSTGSSLGIMADRAGPVSAPQTAWSATTEYRNQTRWKSSSAAAASTTDSAAAPIEL